MKYVRLYKATKEAEKRNEDLSLEERLERISDRINYSNVPNGFNNGLKASRGE